MNISFDDAIPTKTHMALKKLIDCKKIKFIISQNIDGLHLKSGVQRQHLAELHGNMFTEQCDKCGKFVKRTKPLNFKLFRFMYTCDICLQAVHP